MTEAWITPDVPVPFLSPYRRELVVIKDVVNESFFREYGTG